MSDSTIFTIGHSNHLMPDFIKILNDNYIDTLIDIRSSPYSKHVPQFNKKQLQESMENVSIEYIFLGPNIGGKPRDAKYYKDGKVNYQILSRTLKFKDGIRELTILSKDHKIVLMCSEENPYNCHRHHLIGQNLLKKGFKVTHIRKNGVLEPVKDFQNTLF
ncbi:DUF488 family protein [Methanobacterium alcaliphilum]|uniref:DUF488 domain-containing protein n=1 Tax=Methanobacterium alcaliphilum TaxID=392018 RepID=UPI00200AF02D|nr:DUF488 domain-containing protein [Methanobacterium alcaliphilum]MCK9151846.1 DUF488 domain-containing protein [Methanobacterium alcaliphilum]